MNLGVGQLPPLEQMFVKIDCGSVAWVVAIAAKSITGGWPVRRALVSILERALATTLSIP